MNLVGLDYALRKFQLSGMADVPRHAVGQQAQTEQMAPTTSSRRSSPANSGAARSGCSPGARSTTASATELPESPITRVTHRQPCWS